MTRERSTAARRFDRLPVLFAKLDGVSPPWARTELCWLLFTDWALWRTQAVVDRLNAWLQRGRA